MALFGKFGNKGGPKWLVVGLGNPGITYEKTRHNAGFLALDKLAASENIRVDRLKYQALIGQGEIAGISCLLMKPQTYMNNSGQSVSQAAAFYKIPPQNILVFFDDITQDPGVLRIRRNGSHGGHNGAKDISQLLGSDDYPRIRLGIGDKPHKDYDLAAWVLSKFTDAEWKEMEDAADRAAKAAKLIIQGQTDLAMNRFNTKKKPKKEGSEAL